MTHDIKEQKESEDPVSAIRDNLNTAKDTLTNEDASESALISDLKDELSDNTSDTSDSSDTTSISIDPSTISNTTPSVPDDTQVSDDNQTSNNAGDTTDTPDSE